MASFFRDLAGSDPLIMDLPFNYAKAADGDTIAYEGAFVKLMQVDDIANGIHVGLETTTVNENFVGILMEGVAASGATFLLNTASVTGTWTRKKVLVNPHATYLVEYTKTDVAGSNTTDDGFVAAAAGTLTTTCPAIGTADVLIGGWLYFIDGSNASYLHNILDNSTTQVTVFRTAMRNAVAVGDTALVIMPPMRWWFDLSATFTSFKSEAIIGTATNKFQGIDYWFKSPGWPFQKLNPLNHDGLQITNARFFHEVTHSGEATTGSIFDGGLTST